MDENILVRGRNFHCSLCDIKITSEKAVQDHLKGKKHLRLLDLRKCRQTQAEHSVFVGGLNKLMSELALTDHFMQYGNVSKVIVDKDKGQYAIVEFSDKEAVSNAAKQEKQVLQGCKITVRPREHKPFAIHSKGPKGDGGGKLSPQSSRYGTVPAELQKAIVLRLAPLDNISDQMKELMSLLELPASGMRLRYLICTLLQEVFKEFFPACQVFPFGSSVNGFGVLGCDLDLHLEPDGTGFNYQFAKLPAESAADVEEEEPMDDNTDEDTEPKEDMEIDLKTAAAKDVMELICKVLKQCVPSCQNIKAILHARRPVVKFQHKESKLCCDISMNNRLAMRNTELLNFYTSLDGRMRPLVYTIRHWAKVRQLAGNPGAGPRLTNYALSLMVVYYMQTRSSSILPTIEQLRKGQETSNAELIEGWDCSFSKDTKGATSNTETLVDLVREFFHFYSTFDFTTNVISLKTGTALPISTFTPPESPVHKGQVFRLSAINIQDPFELSHNVAFNVNEKVVLNLHKAMKKTYTLCLCNKFKKKQASDEEGVWGLPVLFDPSSYGNAPRGRSGSTSTDGSVHGDGSATYSITVNMKASQLSDAFVKAHSTSDSLKMAWCEAAIALIKRILQDVLRIQCEERTSDKGQAANSETVARRSACKDQDGGSKKEMEEEDKSETDNKIMSSSDKSSTGGEDVREFHGKEDVSTTTRKHLLQEEEEEDGSRVPRKRPRLSGECTDGAETRVMERCDSESSTKAVDKSLSEGDECQPTVQGSKVMEVDEATGNGQESFDYQQADEEEQTHLMCSASYQVWLGRRKVRRHLYQTDPQQATNSSPDKMTASAFEDRLKAETLVTDHIISQATKEEDQSVQPLTKFKVLCKKSQETGQCSIDVILQPLDDLAHFKALFQFLQTFLVKIVDQIQL